MKISIITPSYFRAGMIEQAIQSVLTQKFDDFEHIVIDGDSTDGTLEVLFKYPHLITIVEPDQGLYDAVNKGLQIARGEIIGLLNTDDYYEQGIFEEIASIFESDMEIDAVIGQADIFVSSVTGETHFDRFPVVDEETFLDRLLESAPVINAWFFRRRVFDRAGNFDLNFPIAADRDFLIRLYLAGLKPLFVNKVFYHYRMHSESLTINSASPAKERFMAENLQLAEKYLDTVHSRRDFRSHCMNWHDLTAIELCIAYIRQGKLRNFLAVMRSAIKYNPKWPFIVASQSPVRIKNYLKKKYATNR